jgi:rhamnulokinase
MTNMRGHHFLAVDLGAESGRGMLGTLAEGKLAIAEVHRFPNIPAMLPDQTGLGVAGDWH